jgi:uncharacterized protein with GYD domain
MPAAHGGGFDAAPIEVEKDHGAFGVLILSAEDETKALQCLAALAAAGNVRTETLRAFDAKGFDTIVG